MRPIKFRAWDKKTNAMVGGFYVRADGDVYWETDDGDAFPEAERNQLIVMQFTGLLDRNGKEIYDGDIVKKYALISEIVWNERNAGFFEIPFIGCSPSEMEVIGNIHENPELIAAPSEEK